MLLHRVRAFAARHTLWRPETRVLVALSGGSDSVALLHILRDLHAAGELRLEAAAHFNHHIRGAEADRDEDFCRHVCAALDVPLIVGGADVPALAQHDGVSIEVAARRVRHEFLLAACTSRGADRVATAHTRDDQAETVLLHLVRGAGLRGVSGIAPRRGPLVRPLLECSRDELCRHLEARGQPWREDATNADVTIPRNRMRHEILPRLTTFNPRAHAALARLADLVREDDDWLAREATAIAFQVIGRERGHVRLARSALAALPPALGRRVAQAALQAARQSQPTLREVQALLDVAAGRSRAVEVRGLRMEHSGRFVVLVIKGARRTSPPFSFPLSIPGSVVGPGGWTLSAMGPLAVSEGQEVPPQRVVLDAGQLGLPLVVRSRRAGDWLRPVGVNGRKKVQDLLVDRKVRADIRNEVPIVAEAGGRIVWVAGLATDADFRPSSDTNAVVILELRRIDRAPGEGSASPGSSRRPR
jgi:tRNA(Ile)-lysidine synthase